MGNKIGTETGSDHAYYLSSEMTLINTSVPTLGCQCFTILKVREILPTPKTKKRTN